MTNINRDKKTPPAILYICRVTASDIPLNTEAILTLVSTRHQENALYFIEWTELYHTQWIVRIQISHARSINRIHRSLTKSNPMRLSSHKGLLWGPLLKK